MWRGKRIVVCCGAGGVGKTTVSTGIALAAAREGQRVLIVTIDPSKRLAEVLGVDSRPRQPVTLDAKAMAELGVGSGSLAAWVLDPLVVAEDKVRAVISDPSELEAFLANPIFRKLCAMTAGMQEYAAMVALNQFVNADDYDVVVVDTPPSRHALDFLHAPERLAQLFDSRIMRLFKVGTGGYLRRKASRVVFRLLESVTGENFADDFLFFLTQFERVFVSFEGDASAMLARLKTDEAAFVIVTSTAEQSIDEGFLFQDRARRLKLPLAGFIINRSSAHLLDVAVPSLSMLPDLSQEAYTHLVELAAQERQRAAIDAATVQRVRKRVSTIVTLPLFSRSGSSLAELTAVADRLAEQLREEPDYVEHRNAQR